MLSNAKIFNEITEIKDYQEFLTKIDEYLQVIFREFKKDSEQEWCKSFDIAASFAFTNHNIEETVVIQIGDTMVFNTKGDLIIPLDGCLYSVEKKYEVSYSTLKTLSQEILI